MFSLKNIKIIQTIVLVLIIFFIKLLEVSFISRTVAFANFNYLSNLNKLGSLNKIKFSYRVYFRIIDSSQVQIVCNFIALVYLFICY